jgi:hypothetical protein
MNFGIGTFSFFLVAMTISQTTAFTVGGTFLSTAEKAALEKTAEAVATAGKGITGTLQQTRFDDLTIFVGKVRCAMGYVRMHGFQISVDDGTSPYIRLAVSLLLRRIPSLPPSSHYSFRHLSSQHAMKDREPSASVSRQ